MTFGESVTLLIAHRRVDLPDLRADLAGALLGAIDPDVRCFAIRRLHRHHPAAGQAGRLVSAASLFEGGPHPLARLLGPFERGIYRVIGTDPAQEMKWSTYAVALLLFNGVGALLLFLLMRFQGSLPLNPQNYPNVESRLAFNTAVSFVTNTNWQSYSGEVTMSNLTQMVGSGGAELPVGSDRHGDCHCADPRIRAPVGKRDRKLLGRCDPGGALCAAADLHRGRAGLRRSRRSPELRSLHRRQPPSRARSQTIAQGPVASQEAIKELGTNGGGFFNANSAHPFENPTPFTNLLRDGADLR